MYIVLWVGQDAHSTRNLDIDSKIKITPESGINVVFFLLVAGAAESLQIADVILTATGKGDNVVDGEVSF